MERLSPQERAYREYLVKEAFTSAEMEGCMPTEKIRAEARKLIDGKISIEDFCSAPVERSERRGIWPPSGGLGGMAHPLQKRRPKEAALFSLMARVSGLCVFPTVGRGPEHSGPLGTSYGLKNG